MRDTSHPRLRAALPLAVKVPEITLIFWVLKLLTTGMGEAMSDFMGQHSVPIAGAVGIFGLAFALWLQFRSPEYRAVVYWFAVMMVAVFGTMAADGIHDGAAIPYTVTTPLFAVFVALTFLVWHRSEGTLSIHSINTRRREAFYWTAVLGTFALGTAAGDLTAYSLNLGFWASAALFAVVFAIPGIAWWRFNLNPVLAFWAAYVVTRPLGASFADALQQAHQRRPGLGRRHGERHRARRLRRTGGVRRGHQARRAAPPSPPPAPAMDRKSRGRGRLDQGAVANAAS